ncbi:MAG: hypothetical protein AAF639_12970 [Chloroflexota bacterium]
MIAQMSKDDEENFFEQVLKIIQKAKLPFDIFQTISDAETPEDIALNAIQNEEQLNRFLARYREPEQQA